MTLSRDPDKLREWQRTSKPLTRKSRMKQVNRKRRERGFKRYYGTKARVAWIKSLPCAVPLCDRRDVDAAHVRSRGAGGGPESLVPLCRPHHADQHSAGIETFQQEHSVDLEDYADELAEAWRERNDDQ